MANFKRRSPRAGASKRYSQTGWRARNNMKPIKIPEFEHEGKLTFTYRIRRSPEYQAYREWRSRVCWPASGPDPMRNRPRWHDVLHHTRPRRRRDRAMISAVFHGKIDPENAAWELSKKPHIWYW